MDGPEPVQGGGPLHLFRRVGQVEIEREGSGQGDGRAQVGRLQEGRQLVATLDLLMAPAELADLLDQGQEVRTDLTGQRLAEERAQEPDVGPQGSV